MLYHRRLLRGRWLFRPLTIEKAALGALVDITPYTSGTSRSDDLMDLPMRGFNLTNTVMYMHARAP